MDQCPVSWPDRGDDYEARCAYWESLTAEDIWGPTDPPPARPALARESVR